MSKFEMPNNEDFENMLKKNLEHTNPLKMKEKQVADKNYLFPFWTPVKSDGAETFYGHLSNRNKETSDKDLTGIIKIKKERESYEDPDFVTNLQNMMKNMNGLNDNTGAVKPKAENMPTGTTEKVTEYDSTTGSKSQVNKSTNSETGVGAVKPTSEDMPKGTNDQVTNWDSTEDNGEKVEKSAKSKTGVGAVTPQSEDMPNGTKEQITNHNGTQGEVEVKSMADDPKGDNVGAVKPSSEFKMELPKGIDFSRYM